jgi:hypothetical protein
MDVDYEKQALSQQIVALLEQSIGLRTQNLMLQAKISELEAARGPHEVPQAA